MSVLIVIFIQLSEPGNLNQRALKVLFHFCLPPEKNNFSSLCVLRQDFLYFWTWCSSKISRGATDTNSFLLDMWGARACCCVAVVFTGSCGHFEAHLSTQHLPYSIRTAWTRSLEKTVDLYHLSINWLWNYLSNSLRSDFFKQTNLVNMDKRFKPK